MSDGYAFISENQVYFSTEQIFGKEASVIFYNSLGQIVVNKKINVNKNTVNSLPIPELNSGIYYIKLLNDNKMWVKKIIKI
jgi:hypothetical protein